MKLLVLCLLIMVTGASVAQSSPSQDLETLGTNRDVIRRAKKIAPNEKVQVVQKRAVDRSLRLESSLSWSWVSGGDPFTDSSILGLDLDFHITPKWSIGARYGRFDNDPSREGQRLIDNARQTGTIPDVQDFAKDFYLGTVTYYPIYGKINFFNINVTQFDVYVTGGYGQINLEKSGPTQLFMVGGGTGFWLTNWLTARFEIRYQTYKDIVGGTQERRLDQTVFTGKLGFLL